MDGFRKAVKLLLDGEKSTTQTTPAENEKPKTSEAGVLYRVQVGAFGLKQNATYKMKAVNSSGFDAFVVQVGNLWKVQVGAFANKPNAENMLKKLNTAGYTGVVVKSGESGSTPTIKVGCTVRVKNGAKTYDGVKLAPFIYSRDHQVKQISGNRVVITYDGIVVAAIHKDNLILQ